MSGQPDIPALILVAKQPNTRSQSVLPPPHQRPKC